MTLRDFLKRHKDTIDAIAQSEGAPKPPNNAERELWVRNNERLYRMAQRRIRGFQ